jgi:ATP-dependent DNA helicase RecG
MPREIFEDRLMRSKSNRYKWEDHICEGITIADLEEQRIRGGVRLGVERGRMPESSLMETTESLVEKLKLTTNGKLKNAAAVLFLRDTSQFPQFLLRMARFRGNDKMEFIDNQRAYGNFFTLLDAGMAFFFKHLSLSGKIVGFTREEKLEIPAEALREALTNALCHRMFHNTSSSVGIAIYDDRVEIENTGHLPDELTVETIKQSHHSYPQNPTIADVLFKTTFLENWGSGVGRMVDACKKANLPEPEFNQNAAFVWVTFKRATIQPYNHTSSPYNPATIQVHHTTSKVQAKNKRIKQFLLAIGENGANLKALMDSMNLRNRSSFVNTYIAPTLAEGYIAMLYPEAPNHPMQSYYLTNKGRDLLKEL